ncbi:hypothetical protein BJV82DRAFT_601689 [Fennellomyces sp. T-0311]|nr:hypothetical protein BJV82DRAFT_601689 [Fennellomyces sp. T-0311]
MMKTLLASLLITAVLVAAQQQAGTETVPVVQPSETYGNQQPTHSQHTGQQGATHTSPSVIGTHSPASSSPLFASSDSLQQSSFASSSPVSAATSSPVTSVVTSASETHTEGFLSSLRSEASELSQSTENAAVGVTADWPQSLLLQASALVALFAASFAVLLA